MALFLVLYYYATNGAEESAELHSHYVHVSGLNNDRFRHIRQRVAPRRHER